MLYTSTDQKKSAVLAAGLSAATVCERDAPGSTRSPVACPNAKEVATPAEYAHALLSVEFMTCVSVDPSARASVTSMRLNSRSLRSRSTWTVHDGSPACTETLHTGV